MDELVAALVAQIDAQAAAAAVTGEGAEANVIGADAAAGNAVAANELALSQERAARAAALEALAQAEAAAGNVESGVGAGFNAAAQNSLNGVLAAGTVRIGAYEVGLGRMGFAMASVVRQSAVMSSVLATAFPILALLAAGQAINFIADYLDKASRAAATAAGKWDDLTASTIGQANSLDLANAKLEDQIAKLEGHPNPNRTAEGLAEARVEADKLLKSLEDDADKASQLLETQNIGFFQSMLGDSDTTSEIKDALEGPLLAYQNAIAETRIAEQTGDKASIAQAKATQAAKLADIKAAIAQQREAVETFAKGQLAGGGFFGKAIDPGVVEQQHAAQFKTLNDMEMITRALEHQTAAGEKNVALQIRLSELQTPKTATAKTAQLAVTGGREEEHAAEEAIGERLEMEKSAADEGAAEARTGSVERINAYRDGIASIKVLQLEWLNDIDTASATGDKNQLDSATRTYDGITRAIDAMTKKYLAAEKERTLTLQKEMFDRAKLETGEADRKDESETKTKIGGFEGEKQRITELANAGIIGKKAEIAALKQLDIAEEQVQVAELQRAHERLQLEMLMAGLTHASADEKQRIAEALVQIDAQIAASAAALNEKLKALDTQTSINHMKVWLGAFDIVSNAFQKSMTGMIMGTQTFRQAMFHMWQSIAGEAISAIMKILMQHLKAIASQVIAHVTGEQTMTAATTAGTATRSSVGILETLKSIGRAAAKAAAWAFSGVMETVIPPLNFILAPIAAAGAFAGVMMFSGLASAAGGADRLPRDMFLLAHQNEMVMSAPLAQGVRDMVESKRSPSGEGGSGEGGIHFHDHTSISSWDARDVGRTLAEHQGELVKLAMRMQRAGALG